MSKKIFFLLILFLLIGLTSFTNALTIQEINSIEEKPVLFFSSTGCSHCAKVEIFIQSIEENYPNVKFIRLNINENIDLILELYKIYSVAENQQGSVPIVFIGNKYYLGDTPIIENLETEINLDQNSKILTESLSDTNSGIVEGGEVNLMYVLTLAVVDAVNPCELAVLIILMTAILTRFPEKKEKALKAGLLFTLAIFIMYFIFGIFLVELFTTISGTIGNLFMIIISILAIILGILNIKDYFNYGGGGFIMEVPQKWRPKMKAIINGTTSPKGAFVVGLIVSFFLTPCTAGPYFIFSGIMAQIGLFNALPYLIIYMLIFISPMLSITLITYFGFAQVSDMEEWRSRNLTKLHLVAGLIMLLIGIWLILTTLGFI